MPIPPSLFEIAAETTAGKGSTYLDVYTRYFDPIRHAPLRLLELGVDRGGSLEMWARYFPNARVVGLDLGERAPERYSTERIRHVIGPQEDAALLETISNEEAPDGWDIIIDDCAHSVAPALASFQALFPRLRAGGFYAVEDWGTGYWPHWDDGAGFDADAHFRLRDGQCQSHQAGMVGLIKQLIDELGVGAVRSPKNHTQPEMRKLRRSMLEYVHAWSGVTIVRKGEHGAAAVTLT